MRALRLDLEARRLSISLPKRSSRERLFVAGREEVEDAAAHREVADLADQVDAAVAERRQADSQPFEVDLVATRRTDRRQAGGLRQAPEQGARRHQQRPQAAGERVRQRRDLLAPAP